MNQTELAQKLAEAEQRGRDKQRKIDDEVVEDLQKQIDKLIEEANPKKRNYCFNDEHDSLRDDKKELIEENTALKEKIEKMQLTEEEAKQIFLKVRFNEMYGFMDFTKALSQRGIIKNNVKGEKE